MKILHINKFFWMKGGSETYYFALTELLQTAGHQVIPFSMQSPKNIPSPFSNYFVPEVDFHSPGHPLKKSVQFLYSKTTITQLEQLIAEQKPDLAHVHNIAHQLTPAILPVLKRHGIPVVQTLHDYQLICPNYKLYTQGAVCERCFKHQYYNAALNKCLNESVSGGALGAIEMTLHKLVLKSYNSVDTFICPSRFLFDRLVAWGIPKEKLTYLPNFIQLSELPILPKQDFFLYAGRLNTEKGIELLLEAARQLPEHRFIICGEAETAEQTEMYKIKINQLINVEWQGKLPVSQVRNLMSQAKALVVPSEWYENAPMNVLEAKALGTWVVASRRGGLPELVTEHSGVLFEPGSVSGLVAALRQTAQLPEKSPAALEERFTAEYHLQQVQEIYARLLKP